MSELDPITCIKPKPIFCINGDVVDGNAVYNDAFEYLCKGDKKAIEICTTLLQFADWADNIVDGDLELNTDALSTQVMALMMMCSTNKLWQEHYQHLMGIVMHGFAAWIDSNDMEKSSDFRIRALADAVKVYYFEVVWAVAFIKGGWPHMRECQKKYRGFDIDFPWEIYHRVREVKK